MRSILAALICATATFVPAGHAVAEDAVAFDPRSGNGGVELPPYLECVPYARTVSGIQIYGDAWTWWDKADGIYQRGSRPQTGAVLAFVPHGNMRLGHVAAVSRVIDARTVLLSHSNWSPINGMRGQIERDVRAVDVSPGNDWSQVRVWYAPLGDLGTTAWPAHGFIYPKGDKRRVAPAPVAAPARLPVATLAASAPRPAVPRAAAPPVARAPATSSFSAAFADLGARPAKASSPVAAASSPQRVVPARSAPQVAVADEGDVIGDIIRQRR